MSLESRHQTQFSLSENPSGWRSESTAKLPFFGDRLTELDLTQLNQNRQRRWQELCGVNPKDSYFTVVVPIHEEEKYLPSFLTTLMLSDIPFDVNANFIAVTNACQDTSDTIVEAFMDGIGTVEVRTLTDDFPGLDFGDASLEKNYSVVTLDSIKIMHLNTRSAGKANALNIANKLAIYSNHPFAMCIDANNFPEPDAVGYMFAAAYDSIVRRQDGTVVLSGKYRGETTPSLYTRIAAYIKKDFNTQTAKKPHQVSGCLMAWSTNWLENIGGFLPIASQDYAAGVLARYGGKRIGHVDKAIIWGKNINTLRDKIEQGSRSVRGKLQLVSQYPQVKHIVAEDDWHYFSKINERLKELVFLIRENPEDRPYSIVKFLIWEIILLLGKIDFIKDPSNPSWKPIRSTK